jgi:hypothetical protein
MPKALGLIPSTDLRRERKLVLNGEVTGNQLLRSEMLTKSSSGKFDTDFPICHISTVVFVYLNPKYKGNITVKH